jgi:hypothetical protein
MFHTNFSQWAQARFSATATGMPACLNAEAMSCVRGSGQPPKFAQEDFPVRNVFDQARLDPIQANEQQTAHHALGPEQCREFLFASESILQRQHGGVGPTSGGSSFGNKSFAVVFSAITAKSQTPISSACGRRGVRVKISFDAFDLNAASPHNVIIRSQ